MIKKLNLINGFLTLLILSSLLAKDAKAYLDPGSNSYLLQILFAGFFSVLLSIKTFWKKIVLFGKQVFGRKEISLKDEKPASK